MENVLIPLLFSSKLYLTSLSKTGHCALDLNARQLKDK